MKMRKILAALAAGIVAVSALAVSASALKDNQKAYQFGGAQVTWGVDLDGDDEADTGDGSKDADTWLGSLDGGSGTIKVPVEKGAVVDLYCLSWDSVTDKAIFTATIGDKDYDCYYSAEKPAVSYTVEDDITELEVAIQWLELEDGVDGAWNDWCGCAVIVTAAGDAAGDTPADDTPADDTPADDNNTNTGASAGLALAGLALAGVAIVATKKSK